jgi:hypothetical protein
MSETTTAAPAATATPTPKPPAKPRTRKVPAPAPKPELTGLEAAKADAAARDASVLAGISRPATAPKPKAPARRTQTAKPTDVNGKVLPARKSPAKPAKAPAPEPASEPGEPKANGASPARTSTRAWARKVATVLAEAFADDSDEAKAKVAYWIHGLPYGGADGSNAGGAARWFPEGLPRPTTADWR